MNGPRRWLYPALILVLMGGIALWRMDLFLQAFHVTMRQLQRGGEARWRVLGEIFLFGSILLMTLRVIPLRMEPKKDALIALFATVLGWIVEAWGTRTGVWSYYTGEKPPLWVVPGWTLGALVIGRVAEEVEARWGRLLEGRRPLVYWGFAFAFTAVFWAFVLPAAPRLSSLAVFLLLLAGLLVRPDPRDAALLLTGLAYVFIADFWGTTNGCWAYYVQRKLPCGIALGIGYGMFLDTALVFASIKAARLALGVDRRQ